jgi:5'-methylthioadenosine phosphorylase
MKAEIAIIGGTGVYSPDLFHTMEEVDVPTIHGETSDKIKIAELGGKTVAFLPRHGSKHTIPAHKVNYHANIRALKELGVKKIIGLCAVGSLKEHMKPGDFVLCDQYIDFTKQRRLTFYDGDPVVHISTADPFCPQMRAQAIKVMDKLKIPVHSTGTYACIEGPRFSTRAESRMFRSFADIIGMTLIPEVNLAIESEMCYLSIASVTDYDVWADRPVNVAVVLETMKKSNELAQKIVKDLIPILDQERKCPCPESLKYAVVK